MSGRFVVRRVAGPSPWSCRVCGSLAVSVCPWGGPFGSSSRVVSGFWLACLSCGAVTSVSLPRPFPLSVARSLSCVFLGEQPSSPDKAPFVDPETGEILESEKWAKVHRIMDEVLGPRNPYAHRSKWSGWGKQQITGFKGLVLNLVFAGIAIIIIFTATGVIPTTQDSRSPVGHNCEKVWVDEVGWSSQCEYYTR